MRVSKTMLGVLVTNFGRYDAVHGSAATIVDMAMCCSRSAAIVLAGAEIDIARNPAE